MALAVLSLSEAKATFSQVIERVDSYGESVIIKRRNRPIARIIPFSSTPSNSAAGALSDYAKPGVTEEGAFEEAMVSKHAANR